MKLIKLILPLMIRGNGVRTVALATVFGCSSWQLAHSATINLSTPVSNSVGTITGIYWTGNSITTATPPADNTTPDSSGNGYTGGLQQLGGSATPSLTTGVDLPGTSGFQNGIYLEGDSSGTPGVPGYTGNSRIYRNLPTTSNLSMVNADFTGGAWLKFDSITAGVAQTVNIMGLGQYASLTQHWAFFLTKNTADYWQIGFQTGNGTMSSTGYHNGTAQPLDLQDGTWHHLGFSYDYATGNNLVTFWLDGANVGTASLSVDIVTGAAGSTASRFAVAETSTTTYRSRFNGSVDDVFVTTGIYDFGAIPEPGTATLLIMSAGVLLMGRRRRVTVPLA